MVESLPAFNQFLVNWAANPTSVEKVQIELSTDNDFTDILLAVDAEDPASETQLIDGLNGATRYYYRLKVTFTDRDVKQSDPTSVISAYQSEAANTTSPDGICLAGKLYYLNSNPAKSPAIILLGHFSISNMWNGEDLFLDLVAMGYICYVVNLRGHAPSCVWDIPPMPDAAWLSEFITDFASLDMKAFYDYLVEHEKVDPDRIGMMGGSMGANLSMMGNGLDGVVVSVGLTTSRLGIADDPLKNVLLIASELDCNPWVCFEEEAEYLYNSALEPKKIIIIPGNFHGLDMLAKPALKPQILDWINARMTE